MTSVKPGTCASPQGTVGWLPSPLRASATKQPQATHRELTADDFRHGADRQLTSPKSAGRRRVARPPKLETVFEERKLRTKRADMDDPLPNSTLRFSATYCPRALGPGPFPGMPLVWQHEHLENFAVLARWGTHYINVTQTWDRQRIEGLRAYALPLYREAFHRGQLR